MLYAILGVILQIAGFVFLCRLGGRFCERIRPRGEWAPLAAVVPIALVGAGVFLYHPGLNFVTQTLGLWCFALIGGILVRALRYYR